MENNKKALTIMIAIFIFSLINLASVINLLYKNNNLQNKVEAYEEYDFTFELLQKNSELGESWRLYEDAIIKKREEIRKLNGELQLLEEEKYKIEDQIDRNRKKISLGYEIVEVTEEEDVF